VSLKPESQAAHDPYVVRLFVEYSLLDLPSEETPLSLPKPAPGQSVHYNYSNGKQSQRCLVLCKSRLASFRWETGSFRQRLARLDWLV